MNAQQPALEAPTALEAYELRLPEITPQMQVDRGFVSPVATRTAQDAPARSVQLGSGFRAIAQDGIFDRDPAEQPERNYAITREQAVQAYGNARQLEGQVQQQKQKLEVDLTGVRTAEQEILRMEQQMNALSEIWEKDPTPVNAILWQDCYNRYIQAQQGYRARYDAYASAYGTYSAIMQQYDDAMKIYNDYVGMFAKEDGSLDYELLAQAAEGERDRYLMGPERQQYLDGTRAAQVAQNQSYLRGGTAQPGYLPGQGTGYVQHITGPEPQGDDRLQELDSLASYYRGKANEQADEERLAEQLKAMESWTEEEKRMLEFYAANQQGSLASMTRSMLAGLTGGQNDGAIEAEAYRVFAQLASKYGADTVRKYAESWSRYKNAQTTQQLREGAKKSSNGFWGGVAGSLGSVAANVAGSVTAPLGALGDAVTRTGQYRTLDPNNAANLPNVYSAAVRENVAGNIEGSWAGKFGSTLYQAGMSAADNLARLAVSGGNEAISLGLAATGSFGQTMSEASSKGATPFQATTMALGAAALEVLTEKISLDKLLSDVAAAPKNVGEILKRALTAGMVEVSEEEMSFLGNLVLEMAVLRSGTDYNRRVGELVDGGMSYREAVKTADRELGEEIVNTGVQSFLSGGMLSGGTNLIGYAKDTPNRREVKGLDLKDGDIQTMIMAGLKAEPDSVPYQVAAMMQEKIGAGEDLSNAEVLLLHKVNGQALQSAAQTAPDEGAEAPSAQDQHREQAAAEVPAAQSAPQQAQTAAGRVSINPGVQVKEQKMAAAQRLSELTGREIVFYHSSNRNQNGYYNPNDGKIYLNTNGARAAEVTFAHELTHSVERAGAYGQLRDAAFAWMKSKGMDIDAQRQQIRNLYTENGVQLQSREDVDREMVARFVEHELLTNEQSIRDVVRYDRTLGQKILNWIDGLLAKFQNKKAQERVLLENARRYYAQALKETETGYNGQRTAAGAQTVTGTQTVTGAQTAETGVQPKGTGDPDEVRGLQLGEQFEDSEEFDGFGQFEDSEEFDDYFETLMQDEEESGMARSYSFGGESAETADLEALERAKRLERQGIAAETIRRETGWFKGRDGKWRWEIDDSGMQYHAAGDALFSEMHPEYARHQELMRKWLYGELTAREEAEFRGLDEIWGRERQRLKERADKGNAQLQNMIRHDALFEAYPWLRNTKVRFAELPDGTRGQYHSDRNEIVLNNSLRHAPESTLIHEIQHAIQKAEGFASGASTEYWDGQQVAKPEYAEGVRRAEAALDQAEARFRREWSDDINLDLAKRYVELDGRVWDEGAEAMDEALLHELSEQMEQIEQAAAEGGWDDLLNDYYYAVGELQMARYRARLNRRTSLDLYRNTAGEIEARDAAARRTMTPEERKNTPPDLGGEETVFAEMYLSGWTSAAYDPETASVKKQISNSAQRLSSMPIAGSFTVPTNMNDKRTATQWAIELLKPTGYRVDRQNFGVIHFNEADIRYGLNYADTPEEKAAIAALPAVLKRGVEIGRHDDHKNRGKTTVTIAAPVELNGTRVNVAAVVVLNGNHYYTHRVVMPDGSSFKFGQNQNKKDATREPLRGAPENGPHARATSVASKDNIPQSAKGVKQFSISGPVEESGDLIAMHNVSAEKLLRTIRLGGMPMPSIAITKSGFGYTDYGDISVLFRKSSIDPQADSRNKVYSGDAMTPTLSRVDTRGKTPEQLLEEMLKLDRSMPYDEWKSNDASDLFGYAAKPYESLEQVRENRGRLVENWDEYAADATTAEWFYQPISEAQEILDELAGPSGSAREAAYDAMIAGIKGRHDTGAIMDVFRGNGFELTDRQAETIRGAYEKLSQMPTPYFEAKPERVVRPDEWALVALPDDADPELRQELEKLGVPVAEYRSGDTASRVAAVNSVPELQFSISEDEDVPGLSLPEVEEEAEADVQRKALPATARDYLERAERKFVKILSEGLMDANATVPRAVRTERLTPIVQKISEEYLRTGALDQELATELFDWTFAESVVRDTEFYDQYKDVKDYLRTTAVTLSKQDQSDIPDFNLWRKSAFGTLKIVNNGGLPVDALYDELRGMAPELFPDSITHPADQLQRMYQVGQMIRVTERSLQEFFGPETERRKRWARYDFDNAMNRMLPDLRQVRRYGEDAAVRAAREAAEVPATAEDAGKAFEQMKSARREYERTASRYLLTQEDEQVVYQLLRGERTPESLDPNDSATAGILAVYKAKQAYEDQAKIITKYKRKHHADLRAKADAVLGTVRDWKDKAVGLAYSRETMRRNILDIVPDRALAKRILEEYFDPVQVAEAASTRFKTEFRDRVRKLGLSRRVDKKAGNIVSEAHAVQLLGEATDNIEYLRKRRKHKGQDPTRGGKTMEEWQAVVDDLWAKNPGLDANKIEGAVREFRKIYDELFRQMNEARVRNGYEPINYLQGYFPHFQPGDGDGILAAFGRGLGIDTQVAALPTTINGLTHTFRPGIQWFGNAQERLGFNTAYDAVEGFDKYIEGVSSVIHHTDNIQRLRALATQIRYNASDEGIKRQVDAVRADDRLTEEEKKAVIDGIYEKGRYTLSNFVTELDEYTNLLANKKSRLDRTVEALMGRKFYTFAKWWENRVGANMIAGNIGSAVTNFIPITQAAARVGKRNMAIGMLQTLSNLKNGDGFAAQSDFITNRRGSDTLVSTGLEKVSKAAGFLMEGIDNFVSESITRAAYRHYLQQGFSEAEALHQADIFAAGVLGDRSKGAMPTLFSSTNPVFKAFTQFQLEVNNQFSEVFKDLPREVRDRFPDSKGKQAGALLGVLLEYFIGAFLFNDLYEELFGRRPALDPLGMLNSTVGDLTGRELPNLIGMWEGGITGEDFQTEKVGLSEAGTDLATEALGNLPFSSGLTLLGVELDGGRIPASSAVPNLAAIWQAATEEGWSGEKRWKEIKDELWKLSYVLPPFGGNQAQKIWKGLEAYFKGGSYSVDKDGNDILQYPVLKDDDIGDYRTALQAALFGKSSLDEAQDWVNAGFNSLGAKQTAVYQDLLDADVDDRDAWELIRALSDARKTEEESQEKIQRRILEDSHISRDGKAIVYYGLLASKSERELMDQLEGMRAEPGDIYETMVMLRTDGLRAGGKAGLLAETDLPEEAKRLVFFEKVTDSREDEIESILASGVTFDEFLEAYAKHGEIDGMEMNAGGKAAAFAYWVDSHGFTEEQAAVIKDQLAFFTIMPASASRYEKLTGSGMDPADAYALSTELGELEPEEGEDQVADVQRWRTCVDFSDDPAVQMSALMGVMSESQFAKCQVANNMDLDPDAYVGYYEIRDRFDTDGNGSFKSAEVKAAIDSMSGYGLTDAQKAVLWQIQNKSWSWKNNPYDTTVGREVWQILNPGK